MKYITIKEVCQILDKVVRRGSPVKLELRFPGGNEEKFHVIVTNKPVESEADL